MLDAIIHDVRARRGPAIPSVCSAHADVLAASMMLAENLDRPLLIEATSNQVNHLGGYTGLSPYQFVADVRQQANVLKCNPDRIILGGDHLGPQVWKAMPASKAMAQASEMIMAYADAGFSKIHLDCSEGCAGEPAQVDDVTASKRAAMLALVAQAYAPHPDRLSYVIGTEVPPPGGARTDDEGIVVPTSPESAAATLAAHEDAFVAAGAGEAFDNVRALVVQPGLEFGAERVDHFDIAGPDRLSSVLDDHPSLCFEAHSTDYQRTEVYPELARRNFGILKVGPALTYAWREAAYALSHISNWLGHEAELPEVMSKLMASDPSAWKKHYSDDSQLLWHFGLADRVRYYWAKPEAYKAVEVLHDFLESKSPPQSLLEQYLPRKTIERATNLPFPWGRAVLIAHVQEALLPYFVDQQC
ncbi:MAG: tagatose-6-phosphate kinase [Boseongicola sp.]|nr:MAG: tagatose-6-phosphate kinase [Boseongicola sp.]